MSLDNLSLILTGVMFVGMIRGPQWFRPWLLTALGAIAAVGPIVLTIVWARIPMTQGAVAGRSYVVDSGFPASIGAVNPTSIVSADLRVGDRLLERVG